MGEGSRKKTNNFLSCRLSPNLAPKTGDGKRIKTKVTTSLDIISSKIHLCLTKDKNIDSAVLYF
jgi:hypothetical protein